MEYIILFFSVMLEGIFPIGYFVPGTLILIVFGMGTALGYFNLFLVFSISFSANLIGSYLNYKFGWKLAKAFKIEEKKVLKLSKKITNHHTGLFIVIGKLIPGVKESINLILGINNTDKKKVIIWNIVGAFLYSILYIFIGYVFYNSLSIAEKWIHRLAIIALIIFFILIGISIFSYIIAYIGKFLKKLIILSFKLLNNFLKSHLSPKIYKFLENRFKRENFSQLPLTILIITLVYLSLAFVGLIKLSYSHGIIYNIDLTISNLMAYFFNYKLAKFFILISFFGSSFFIFFSYLLFFNQLYKINRVKTINLGLALIFTFIISLVVKIIVARIRPDLAVYQERLYSFPSLHTSLSFVFYLGLSFVLAKKIKLFKDKVYLALTALFIVFLIAFSRVYLNEHYFSDILGGFFVGLLGLSLFFANPFHKNIKLNLDKLDNKKTFTVQVVIFIVITTIGAYLYLKSKNINPHFQSSYQNYQQVTYPNLIPNSFLKYTHTLFLRKTEPINFIFLAKNDKQLTNAFLKAGFKPADKITFSNLKKLSMAAYDNYKYQTAPMLPIFWNNHIQNRGFQLQGKNLKTRHHIRIWKSPFITIFSGNIYHIYVGCAVYDNNIKWKITHKISPDIDKEREFFFKKLKQSLLVKFYKKIQLVKAFTGYNFSYDKFFTDGKAYIVIFFDPGVKTQKQQ